MKALRASLAGDAQVGHVRAGSTGDAKVGALGPFTKLTRSRSFITQWKSAHAALVQERDEAKAQSEADAAAARMYQLQAEDMATKLEAAIAAQAQLQRQLAQLTAQLEEAKAAFKGRPPRQLFVEAVQRNSSAPAQSAESPRKQALRTLGLRTPPSDKLPQAPEGAPCASPMSVAPSALVSSGGTRSQAGPPASEVVPASPAKGASGAPDGAGTVKRLSRELASTLSPAKLAPSAGQVRGSPFLVAKGARSSDANAPPPRQPPVVSSGGPGEGGGAISPTEMSFIQLKKFLFSHPRVPRDEVSGATSRAPLLALVDKYGLGSASGSTSGSTSISGSISISGSTSGSTSSSTAKAADTSAAAMAPPPSTGAASTGIASMGVAREGGAVRPRYSALDEAPSTADAVEWEEARRMSNAIQTLARVRAEKALQVEGSLLAPPRPLQAEGSPLALQAEGSTGFLPTAPESSSRLDSRTENVIESSPPAAPAATIAAAPSPATATAAPKATATVPAAATAASTAAATAALPAAAPPATAPAAVQPAATPSSAVQPAATPSSAVQPAASAVQPAATAAATSTPVMTSAVTPTPAKEKVLTGEAQRQEEQGDWLGQAVGALTGLFSPPPMPGAAAATASSAGPLIPHNSTRIARPPTRMAVGSGGSAAQADTPVCLDLRGTRQRRKASASRFLASEHRLSDDERRSLRRLWDVAARAGTSEWLRHRPLSSLIEQLRHSACGLDGIDAAGRTALIIASANGHTDVAKALIAGGADLEKVTFGGETATMAACSNGHADTLALLLDARASVVMAPAGAHDGASLSCLARAAKGGHLDVVQLLLAQRAESLQPELLWTQELNGHSAGKAREGTEAPRTALQLALLGGHLEIALALLDAGATCDVLSAASLGFVSVLEGASSAELEARDLEGHSTLALAASYGHPSCISLLLGKRVDVEARDQGGSTVLMAACEGGHASVVALLLSSLSGAHGTVGLTRALQAQNDDGVTALHLAAAHGHLEVVQQLLQAASGTADALSTALVNQCDRWQRTALLLSISRARSLDVAIELLAVDGCEVDAPDCFGCTPLGVAAAAGVTELVGALLFARADPNRPDRAGETPLMVAAKAGRDGVVSTLLALPGLQVEALNCDGQSALMLATNEAHEGVAAMLVRRGRRAPNSPEDSTGSSPGSELWI